LLAIMMRWVWPFFQFLPLTVFLVVAQSHDFSLSGWGLAFRVGALVGLVQFVVLLPILRHRMNRLVTGMNLFLIVGGAAFYLRSVGLIFFLGELREAGVVLAVSLVCGVALFISRTGAFELVYADLKMQKKYSVYFFI